LPSWQQQSLTHFTETHFINTLDNSKLLMYIMMIIRNVKTNMLGLISKEKVIIYIDKENP